MGWMSPENRLVTAWFVSAFLSVAVPFLIFLIARAVNVNEDEDQNNNGNNNGNNNDDGNENSTPWWYFGGNKEGNPEAESNPTLLLAYLFSLVRTIVSDSTRYSSYLTACFSRRRLLRLPQLSHERFQRSIRCARHVGLLQRDHVDPSRKC